jgi:hypothetical protein
MADEIFELDAQQIPLEQDHLLHALGYPTAQAASQIVLGALPGWIEQTVQKAEPRALIKIMTVDSHDGLVKVADGPAFHGRLLAKTMSGISEAMLLLVTLGEGVSQLISELGAGRALDAMGVDAVASEMVEAAANRFEAIAGKALRPGLPFRTLRFSPGYCDWNVSELPDLLTCFDASRIGVSLTPGGMMAPRKTLAGMTGLTESQEAASNNPCDHCGKKACDHRRSLRLDSLSSPRP